MWRTVNSTAMRGRYSNVVTQSPVASRKRASRSTAACMPGTATNAVSIVRGCGNSFRLAAVMIPSVPSAPMKRSRRSYPVLSLRRLDKPSMTRPSASTTSRPEHEISRHAVAHGREPARVGREIAADLATAFRAERQRKQPVDGSRGRLHVQQHAARFRDQREVGGVDFADAIQPVQRQHELIAARARRGAAAVAGVATLRHDGDARRRCRARAPARLQRSSPDTRRTAWRRGTGPGNPSGSAPSVRVRRCSPPGRAAPGCAGARRRANRVRLPASGPATLRPCGAQRPSPRPARRPPRRRARGSRRTRW